jgi:hypothetical protein
MRAMRETNAMHVLAQSVAGHGPDDEDDDISDEDEIRM